MPHLIDRETGLCSVCQRLQIAAIKEGKKYKRQTYDVRKLAINNLTSKNDPNYKAIIDRHYVKFKDSFDTYKNAHRKPSIEYGLRPTFTKKLSFDYNLAYDDISDENEYYENDSRISQPSRNKYDYREVLRKVNLVQASRLNDRSNKNSSPLSTSRRSNISRTKNKSKLSENNDKGYNIINPSQIKYTNNLEESFQEEGETKFYYLNDLANYGYIYDDSELFQTHVAYQSLPSINWNQFD